MNEIIDFIFSLDRSAGKDIVDLILIVFGVGALNYVVHLIWLRFWERICLSRAGTYVRMNNGLDDTSEGLLSKLSAANVPKFSSIYRRIRDLVQIKQNNGQVDNDTLADIHAGELSRRGTFSRYILGILIILGLIGTLRGLITAITEVQPLLQDIDNLDQLPRISNALQQTLAGMNTAFVTTLAGLITSLGLGFLGWLFNRESSAFLTDFEKFVSIEIVPHFSESSETSIESAVAELSACTNTLKLATEENVRTMQAVIQQLTDNAWGEHLEQQYLLANTFGKTAESLLQSLKGIAAYGTVITSAIETFEGLTRESMSGIKEYQEALRTGLEEAVPKLAEESESLKTTIAEYQTSQATFIVSLTNAIERHLEPITENQEAVARTFSQTSEYLVGSLTEIQEQQTQITAAVEGFNELTNRSLSELGKYHVVLQHGLEEALPRLAAESSDLKTTIAGYQDSQSEFVDQLAQTLQAQLQTLTESQQSTVYALTATIADFREAQPEFVAQLTEALQTELRTLKESQENTVHALTTAIADFREAQPEFVEQLTQALQTELRTVTESQESTVHALTTAIADFREAQPEFVEQLAETLQAKLRTITESQHGMVHILTRLSEEIQVRSAIETQNEVFERIENRLGRYGDQIDQQNELIQTLVATVQRTPSAQPSTRGVDSAQHASAELEQQLLSKFDVLIERVDTLNNRVDTLNTTARRPGIYRWGSEIRRWFGGSR